MAALDGNAIAGTLVAVFGTELTAAIGACACCGRRSLVGEFAVYLRGPIGGYFVWEAALGGPVLLVAGGSGVVPFRSILRHHQAIESTVPVRLLYSARSPAEVIYRQELTGVATGGAVDIRYTLTREQPEGWQGFGRRIDHELLDEIAWPPSEHPLAYVCGPTAFVETASSTLVALGHAPDRIRTERFGPSGG